MVVRNAAAPAVRRGGRSGKRACASGASARRPSDRPHILRGGPSLVGACSAQAARGAARRAARSVATCSRHRGHVTVTKRTTADAQERATQRRRVAHKACARLSCVRAAQRRGEARARSEYKSLKRTRSTRTQSMIQYGQKKTRQRVRQRVRRLTRTSWRRRWRCCVPRRWSHRAPSPGSPSRQTASCRPPTDRNKRRQRGRD